MNRVIFPCGAVELGAKHETWIDVGHTGRGTKGQAGGCVPRTVSPVRPAACRCRLVAAAVLLPLLALADAAPVTLRCWQVPGSDNLSVAGRADLAVFEAFRRQRPEITFEQTAGLDLPGVSRSGGLIMSIAGGTAPDVIYVNFQATRDFVQRGFLQPLDEYIREDITAAEARRQGTFDPDIMYQEELNERLLPQVRNVVQIPGLDGRKHIYALPYSNLAICLLYNKTLFRKAGLDPDKD